MERRFWAWNLFCKKKGTRGEKKFSRESDPAKAKKVLKIRSRNSTVDDKEEKTRDISL